MSQAVLHHSEIFLWVKSEITRSSINKGKESAFYQFPAVYFFSMIYICISVVNSLEVFYSSFIF